MLGLFGIKERDWALFKCSALTGAGLNESIDWVMEKLAPLLWQLYIYRGNQYICVAMYKEVF